MSSLRPQNQLETHEVTNQPPPFEDVNLFTSDIALQEAVARAGAGAIEPDCLNLGRRRGLQQWPSGLCRPIEIRHSSRVSIGTDTASMKWSFILPIIC